MKVRRKLWRHALLFVAPGALVCALPTPSISRQEGGTAMKLQVTSVAFKEGEMIPRKYTCDGEDISPPLAISGIPQGIKSIALISDDPDAPAAPA